jgi:hypothetical protein
MKAEELILKRYMKPVDAIQLAVALNNFPAKPTFIRPKTLLHSTAGRPADFESRGVTTALLDTKTR